MLTPTKKGAGVPSNITGNNVTDWPLEGGSLKLDVHHAWEYIFVNLGLGTGDVSNFNISLTPEFLNSSGKGDLCIPQLKLPDSFKPADGTRASLQVVTVGAEGSALYNCADIRFSANAKVLSGDDCPANPNITYYPVKQQSANGTVAGGSSSGGSGNTTSGSGSGAGGKSAGSLAGVDKTALASVVGLTVALVYGLGF